MTRLEHNVLFILRHLQIIEGNFEAVNDVSRAERAVPRTLDEFRSKAQLRPGREVAFCPARNHRSPLSCLLS